MTIEQLALAHQATPFKPFTIHIADGRQLPVSSPEFIMAPRNSRTFVVDQPDGCFHLIDLLLVTGLEFGPTNDAPRRRRRAS
jgi:hypothetical protein